MFEWVPFSNINEVTESTSCYISSLLYDPIRKGIYNTQVIISTAYGEYQTGFTLIIKPKIVAPFLVKFLYKSTIVLQILNAGPHNINLPFNHIGSTFHLSLCNNKEGEIDEEDPQLVKF